MSTRTPARYLSAFAPSPDWFVPPLSILDGDSLSCGGLKATPQAVLLQVKGELRRDTWLQVMPPLRTGERYHIQLQTEFDDGRPAVMRFVTLWAMVPYPLTEVGALTVRFDGPPMHWVSVHLSSAEAPVMRVASVDGWQVEPPD